MTNAQKEVLPLIDGAERDSSRLNVVTPELEAIAEKRANDFFSEQKRVDELRYAYNQLKFNSDLRLCESVMAAHTSKTPLKNSLTDLKQNVENPLLLDSEVFKHAFANFLFERLLIVNSAIQFECDKNADMTGLFTSQEVVKFIVERFYFEICDFLPNKHKKIALDRNPTWFLNNLFSTNKASEFFDSKRLVNIASSDSIKAFSGQLIAFCNGIIAPELREKQAELVSLEDQPLFNRKSAAELPNWKNLSAFPFTTLRIRVQRESFKYRAQAMIGGENIDDQRTKEFIYFIMETYFSSLQSEELESKYKTYDQLPPSRVPKMARKLLNITTSQEQFIAKQFPENSEYDGLYEELRLIYRMYTYPEDYGYGDRPQVAKELAYILAEKVSERIKPDKYAKVFVIPTIKPISVATAKALTTCMVDATGNSVPDSIRN